MRARRRRRRSGRRRVRPVVAARRQCAVVSPVPCRSFGPSWCPLRVPVVSSSSLLFPLSFPAVRFEFKCRLDAGLVPEKKKPRNTDGQAARPFAHRVPVSRAGKLRACVRAFRRVTGGGGGDGRKEGVARANSVSPPPLGRRIRGVFFSDRRRPRTTDPLGFDGRSAGCVLPARLTDRWRGGGGDGRFPSRPVDPSSSISREGDPPLPVGVGGGNGFTPVCVWRRPANNVRECLFSKWKRLERPSGRTFYHPPVGIERHSVRQFVARRVVKHRSKL